MQPGDEEGGHLERIAHVKAYVCGGIQEVTRATHPSAPRGFDPADDSCHTSRVTRWENKDLCLSGCVLPGAGLVARLHVDLQRVASAVCPRS